MNIDMDPSGKFDLEFYFNFYLETVKLKKEEMSEIQYKETKQAFFAGISSVLVAYKETEQMPLWKHISIWKKLWQQCNDFWSTAAINFQSKKN